MDKLVAIRIKHNDGTYSNEIPLSVLAINIDWDGTHSLVDVLGNVDLNKGSIQEQINALITTITPDNVQWDLTHTLSDVLGDVDLDKGDLQTQIDNISDGEIQVDSTLTAAGKAADAKAVGDNLKNVVRVGNSNVTNFTSIILGDTAEQVNLLDQSDLIGINTRLSALESGDIQTDQTLSIQGMAADAKATGDAIHNLQGLVGTPLVAATAASMTNTDKIYVYTGSETGYTNGNWYYYDGTAWVSGGVYNSIAMNMDTVPTLGSSNPVTSGGIKAALDLMDEDISSLNEDITNQINALALDLAGVESRIDDIEGAEGLKRYGVSGIGNAATTLTRILDSVGMVAQVGTDGDNSGVVNDFDNAVPFNRRKCVGDWELKNGKPVFKVNAYLGDEDYAEDGSMGEYVAVECPRAYYSMNSGTLIISAHKYPGFRPFDIFCRNHDANDTMPFYYKNAYSLALKDGRAVSLPGYDNEQGSYAELLEAVRTYKDGALGNSVILMPAAWNFYEWALFTVEFATTNCQSVMQGCAGFRHNAGDRVDFIDSTKAITNNYYATRVSGEYIAITPANIDINDKGYQATHKITAITRCDENGVPDESGTHQLLELEDLGKGYWEYDSATSYRIAARPYRTGACNGVSTPSGSPVSNHDSYHPCKYRWHENPFGNQFKTAVDLFDVRVGTSKDDWTLDWYLLIDPAGFATKDPAITDLETEDFIKLDVSTEHENYKNGYVKSKKHSKVYPDIWIPNKTVGASTTTYFGDYASLVYSFLVRSVRFGGNWYYGEYAGFSYSTAHNAPSTGPAYYGGDLCVAQ